MIGKRAIDHIVYAVPDLEQAIDDLEQRLGVRPVFGGYHTTQGTKNALLNLGKGIYLEILAKDDQNTAIPPPRWMGIDLIKQPTITRWALKSNDLDKDRRTLKSYHAEMGLIQGGQRKTSNGSLLSWKLIMPLSQPAIDLAPFMVDWQDSASHPTDQLPNICKLVGLRLSHPNPLSTGKLMEQLFIDIDIQKKDQPAIEIKIEGPAGVIQL